MAPPEPVVTPNPLLAAAPAAADADAAEKAEPVVLPEWAQPAEDKFLDWLSVLRPGKLLCLGHCGGVWRVEQEAAPYVDSKEAHFPYTSSFASAVYALASTVGSMYVLVIELVTKRMQSADGASTSKLERCVWGYVMLYPLVIMLIVVVLCLETMAREHLFYAYLRNGILLDLEDAHTNVLSWAYWNPRMSTAGLFPHVCVASTVLLGLVTRGLSSSLLIVCSQSVTLLIFFNSVIGLKSRLVSVSEFVHRTIVRRTAETQAAVNSINVARHKLSTKGIDIDGDGRLISTAVSRPPPMRWTRRARQSCACWMRSTPQRSRRTTPPLPPPWWRFRSCWRASSASPRRTCAPTSARWARSAPT